MMRILQVMFFFAFFAQATFAQSRSTGLIGPNDTSLGTLVLTVGASYCFGDLGSSQADQGNNINLGDVRYVVSLGFRQSFANRFSYRISLHYGLYESADRGVLEESRGYASTSNIFKFTALAEFNIFQSLTVRRPWRVYLYAGGGIAHASIDLTGNPVVGNATYKTSEFAPVIPFGLGFDIWTNPNFNIGLEVGWKYAFSDYMDGVRVARNQVDDILGNVSLTLSYRIFGNNNFRRHDPWRCVW